MSTIFFPNLSKIQGHNVDQVSPTSLKERVSLLMVELPLGGTATNGATPSRFLECNYQAGAPQQGC